MHSHRLTISVKNLKNLVTFLQLLCNIISHYRYLCLIAIFPIKNINTHCALCLDIGVATHKCK